MWRFLLGVFMAVTVIGTAPKYLLAVPAPELTPARILPLGEIPVGGSLASEGTTAAQTELEVSTRVGSTNRRGLSGGYGARMQAGGAPSGELAIVATTDTPGVPGKSGRYQYTSDGKTYFASAPTVLWGVETVASVATGDGNQRPSSVTTPDGVVHVVYERVSTNQAVYLRRPVSTETWFGAPSTGNPTLLWSESPAVTTGTGGYYMSPSIWAVTSDTASGYVLMTAGWFARSSSEIVLRISQSSDKGDTWTDYESELVLTYGASLTYTQTQAVWDEQAQQIVVVMLEDNAGTTRALTYVSDDLAGVAWQGLAGGIIADVTQLAVITYCGQTYLATLEGTSAVTIRRRDATMVDYITRSTDTGADFDDAYSLLLAVDDVGDMYLAGRSDADSDEVLLQASSTEGRVWGATSDGYPYAGGGATVIMDDDGHASTTLADGALLQHAAWVGETLWMVGSLVTSSTTTDNTIVAFRFGGISNISKTKAVAGVDPPFYPVSTAATKAAGYSLITSGTTETALADTLTGWLVDRLSNDASLGSVVYTQPGNTTAFATLVTIGPATTLTGTNGGMILAVQDGGSDHYRILTYIDTSAETLRTVDVGTSGYLHAAVSYDAAKRLTLLLAMDSGTSKASGWFRQPGDTAWTPLFTGQTVASMGTAGVTHARVGKYSAVAEQVDIMEIIPHSPDGAGDVEDLALGVLATAGTGIRATGRPQALPQGVTAWWAGSPLYAGDTHTLTTISRYPLATTSPLSATPSPSRLWRGPESGSGATSRIVYDLGDGASWRPAHGMAFASLANAGPVEQVRYIHWDGSGWDAIFAGNGYEYPFGSDGAVGFARSSAASLIFTPYAQNGLPQYSELDGWVDRWVQFSDGTNTVLGKVTRVHPGQFSNATGVLQSAIELDRDTLITVAGSLSSLSTATTTGSARLYYDDIIVVGITDTDAVQYVGIEWDIAGGATVPQAGLATAGAVYALARQPRDGSSSRLVASDDIAQIPGSGIVQGRKVRRRAQRVFDLPYDSVLTQPGMYSAGDQIGTLAISGSAARATLDSNLSIIGGVLKRAGQSMPVCLVQQARFSADPSSVVQVWGGDQIVWGTLSREFDVTMSRGLPRDLGRHAQSGGLLQIAELI